MILLAMIQLIRHFDELSSTPHMAVIFHLEHRTVSLPPSRPCRSGKEIRGSLNFHGKQKTGLGFHGIGETKDAVRSLAAECRPVLSLVIVNGKATLLEHGPESSDLVLGCL